MKFSSLLLCLCITIAAGAHNYEHPLLMSAGTGSKGLPHRAVKRRDQEEVCNDVLARELCTNGIYEDYAYVLAQCSEREAAENFQDVCSVNPMGTICATIDGPNYDDFNSVCDSTTTCSYGCMGFLTNNRARLGCCLNVYNTTDSSIYSYALWSLCGVEPVTERCTTTFDLPTSVDPTCNEDNVVERLYSRVLCRAEFTESTRNALRAGNCGDYDVGLDYTSLCAVNEQGSYCDLHDNLYYQQRIASVNCPDTDTCDPVCRGTLYNIISLFGCCFISEFNNTAETQRDWLSYEFWQRCGLTSPGFCEQRFTSGPRISSALREAPEIIIILTMIALFLVLFVPPFF